MEDFKHTIEEEVRYESNDAITDVNRGGGAEEMCILKEGIGVRKERVIKSQVERKT